MISLLHRFGAQIAPEFEQTVTMALHVALVVVLAWAGWRLCAHLLRLARERVVARSADADAANRIETMTQVLRYAAAALILVVAGMLTLDQLGIAIAPLVATAGVAGVAIGFGLQRQAPAASVSVKLSASGTKPGGRPARVPAPCGAASCRGLPRRSCSCRREASPA